MLDVLHINDNNLLLKRGSKLITSQGYAWLSEDQVHFDFSPESVAVKRCRLAPQEINNRYWMQCDHSAISANAAGMRHSADLVWQHLSQLKQQHSLNEVVLVVPSHYRAENLQLLLGVAKACGLAVKGLLNKASLALSASNVVDGDYTHMDVQLHQAVSSKISVRDGMVTLGDVDLIQDVGIHLMQEALLKGLQNNFIQNDRFDPLHDAHTEQQLFDQIPKIAEQIASGGKANIGVEHHGKLHSTSVDIKEWQALLNDFSQRLIKAGSGTTFVDLNAAFGTTELAGLVSATMQPLAGVPNIDAGNLVSTNAQGQAVVYQTDLVSIRANSVALAQTNNNASIKNESSSTANRSTSSATHLLSAGQAIAIDQSFVSMDNGVITLSANQAGNLESLLREGMLFVMNDEGRTQLKPNDRLCSNIADGVITVIQVI